jgi:TerC family integral membrane protein
VAVTPLAWQLTIGLIVVLLLVDYFFHVRHAHVPTLKEAGLWTTAYVGIALLFGVAVLAYGGAEMGAEYYAGYVTEKALSVDNVFVFLFILTRFKVPRQDQQKALLFGIVLSMIVRTVFILLGAALIASFAWVFYLFGLLLLVTAGQLFRPETVDGEKVDDFVVRMARRLFRTTDYYDGDRIFTVRDGRRTLTPMLPVMVSLGCTDLLFAMDSIPAIFGLTQNVFIVFTATAFSLLGLRQLFFLIDGDPGLHRRKADPARTAREQRAVHQRRGTGQGRRDQHQPVAAGHPCNPGGDDLCLAAQPRGQGEDDGHGVAPARCRIPRAWARRRFRREGTGLHQHGRGRTQGCGPGSEIPAPYPSAGRTQGAVGAGAPAARAG